MAMIKSAMSFLLAAGMLLLAGCGRGGSGSQPDGVAKDVGDVVDYGIGATQLKARQQSERKLEQIQDQHQRELDEALGE